MDCIIRKAKVEDIPAIMEFIDEHWRKDHILAKSRMFFEYQHYFNDEVSFVVAENPENGELEAILGYILYSEYEERDLFGAIWKVRTSKYPMLGMKMQMFAVRNLNARTFSAVALNPSTLDMHRRWGASLGKMKHYYILSDREEYKIAKIEKKNIIEYNTNNLQWNLVKVSDSKVFEDICEWEKQNKKVPIKSLKYLEHRYFNHPVYEYVKYAILDGEKVMGALVAREIEVDGERILRIIDFLGDAKSFAHIGQGLNNMLVENNYEYIDMYEYGVEHGFLRDAGFVERVENDENIIPNYFEPFVQQNIEIDFYTSSKDGILLFKGDGDQDRPNFI